MPVPPPSKTNGFSTFPLKKRDGCTLLKGGRHPVRLAPPPWDLSKHIKNQSLFTLLALDPPNCYRVSTVHDVASRGPLGDPFKNAYSITLLTQFALWSPVSSSCYLLIFTWGPSGAS